VPPLEQALGETELVHQLHGGRVQRVAAEVAVEVLVLLQQHHGDSPPGQQQRQHHPGRPAAHDAARGF
jgi:hypothetical protein